jgi:hypothetical protein
MRKKGESNLKSAQLRSARQRQWFHFLVLKVKNFAAHRDCSVVGRPLSIRSWVRPDTFHGFFQSVMESVRP